MRREPRVAVLARHLVWGDDSGGILPFSYGAHKLAASLRSAPDLADVETKVIDLQAVGVEPFLEQIREFRPTLVAASTFIWSIELFSQLASEVRRWDPSVRFVMGGPAARPSAMRLSPYAPHAKDIDALVVGEGEEAIRAMVRHHLEEDWQKQVPGAHVHTPLGWRRLREPVRPVLDDYPSPYQLGMVAEADNGYLETFRGCPIACAFCQWGEERADRVHSPEYLAAHLEGLARSGVRTVHALDAAFNLSARAFRNLARAEAQVGVLRERQVLGHVYPTLMREEHVELFEAFGRTELAVGIQSFDADVLKKLGRPFDYARFERVLDMMLGRFEIDFELILGLPGDTPENFRRTFDRAIELADRVRVFYCLALPDALLERAEEFGVEFDPRTFEVSACRGWTAETLRAEWERVQRVASSMPRPYVESNWVDFRTGRRTPTLPDASLSRLGAAASRAAIGWELQGARASDGALIIDFDGASGPLVLEATSARAGKPSFAEKEGIAYSHRGELAADGASRLRAFIDEVHGEVVPVLRSMVPGAGAERREGA
jgi:radical SAM superfamily enzyme YgiQ (UPF0313 family)